MLSTVVMQHVDIALTYNDVIPMACANWEDYKFLT